MKNKETSLEFDIFKENLINNILNVLFLLIVFITAFVFNKLLEMVIFTIAYTCIRLEFTKAIHGDDFTKSPSKAIWICRLITFVVQLISIIFIVKLSISKYFNILLAFSLGIINFFTKDYLEYKVKKYVENRIFYKGMKESDIPKTLVGYEYEIIYLYYVKCYQLNKIAMKIGYSVDNIKKIKAKILKRYSD